MVRLPLISLLLYVGLLLQDNIKLFYSALKSHDLLLTLAEAYLCLIELILIIDTLLFHLGSEAFLLSRHLIYVLLLTLCHLSFEGLDFLFELLYLLQKTLVEILFEDGVCLQLLGDFCELLL